MMGRECGRNDLGSVDGLMLSGNWSSSKLMSLNRHVKETFDSNGIYCPGISHALYMQSQMNPTTTTPASMWIRFETIRWIDDFQIKPKQLVSYDQAAHPLA
jgi:hypothetical protein